MNAKQAIARSRSHDEIVTLDAFNQEDFETLTAECDSSVDANGMWEFWANKAFDPNAWCKAHGCPRVTCDADHEDMEWRVHMPAEST